jgi:hypothetical protein
MKVKATVILTPTQACRVYDRLANLTYSAWEECDYCIPSLTIFDDGSFIAAGQSCEGNFCGLSFDAASSVLRIEINSRRHALWECGNSAGAVFELLRMERTPHPSGLGWWYPADLDILEGFKVQEYDSWRRDVPFWECNLCATPELDYQRMMLEDYFRQWKREVWRKHFLAYDPDRKILVLHTPEEGVEWGRPAVDFLDGMDYRRLAAEGVKL